MTAIRSLIFILWLYLSMVLFAVASRWIVAGLTAGSVKE